MAYTTIDDPSEYFTTTLYTGNGSDAHSITNSANSGNFKPDWLWTKNRTGTARNNSIFDSSRGVQKYLYTNQTDAEATFDGSLQSFDTNGFTVGTSTQVNPNGNSMVSWQWKANGGTTTSQTGSDINSVTQVNTDAGFSIVTYSSPSNADGDNQTNGGAYWRVKHGLGSVPKFAIFKSTSNVHAWYVWHHGFVGASKSDGDHITLNTVGAMASEATILWGNTEWSTTEFEIGGWDVINRSGKSYIAYMFDEVQGYSKFGSYIGNGNANGTFVYTGFKPAWVMCKSTASTSDWYIYDNKREGYNIDNDHLLANSTAAEATADEIDMLSNGFKLRIATDPNVAEAYIYIAFAEHPFVSSKGVPTTAR